MEHRPFVADTHVHLYDGFDLSLLFRSAERNFSAICPDPRAERFLCLTERRGCDVFTLLSERQRETAGQLASEGFAIQDTAESVSLRIVGPSGARTVLVAGRQLATAERLEVLALGTRENLPDGLSLRDAIDAVRAAGATVVLNWSPGKWMLGRYPIVRAAIETLRPIEEFIGDVHMRPTVWPEPALFRAARLRGIRCLAGTDPLPLPGEERLVGSFASAGVLSLTEDAPAASLLDALRSAGKCGLRAVGARGSAYSAVRRFVENRKQHMYRPPATPADRMVAVR